MRPDVKRTLFRWPLAASTLASLVVFVSYNNDPLSKKIVERSGKAWIAAGGAAFWEEGSRRVTQVNPVPESLSVQETSVQTPNPLAAIEAWNDFRVETISTSTPPKTVASEADNEEVNSLFHFPTPEPGTEVAETVAAERPQNGLVAMARPERIDATEKAAETALILNPADTPEPVESILSIDLTEPVEPLRPLEPIDTPAMMAETLVVNESVKDFQVVMPLENTGDTYEAPAPFVADLAPESRDLSEVEGDSLPRLGSSELGVSILELPTMPESNEVASAPEPTPAASEPAEPKVESINRYQVDENSVENREPKEPVLATWPVARQLLDQLDQLDDVIGPNAGADQRSFAVLAWSRRVRDIVMAIPNSPRLGDARVGSLLGDLAGLRDIAASNAGILTNDQQRIAWLQTAYAVERRLAVWQPVHAINSGTEPATQHVTDDEISVSAAMNAVESEFAITGDANGWRRFLNIDEMRRAFTSGDEASKTDVAQQFLNRLQWPTLTEEQRTWLNGETFQQLAGAVRPWASSAIDYSSLLHQIERTESNAIDLVTSEIAESMRSLRYASHPRAKQLANNLDVHYRNANLRLAISDRVINHLLPEIPSRRVPVRTNMLGSRVTGVSQVTSKLSVDLIPAENEWRLSLLTDGRVLTRSVGRRGPAAVSTASRNQFGASTPITIKPTDVALGRSVVDVRGGSRLRGINTDFDGWPLIGSLVRGIAESEYWQKASLSDRIAGNRMRSEIGGQIDEDIQARLDEATEKFSKSVLGPLVSLQLQPRVMDMQTTESRLIARYRMAGDWQLAAMTPRPRAPSDSLLSVQVHQSAMNNTLEQLFVQSTPQPIEELMQQCLDLLGIRQGLPEDLPRGVKIQFAKHRPITVEIEDGRVWMTLRVIRLQKENGMSLRNFIVRASYQADFDGLHAFLVRDGHLSISGPRMSMRQRLPVRAIFNKVLSPTQQVSLSNPELLAERLPAETVISQIELRDGWVGLAFSAAAENEASMAQRPIGLR